MKAIDVIKKNHFTGLQLKWRKIAGAIHLLNMQSSASNHRRQRTDRIEFAATVAEIGVAVKITYPAITWHSETICRDALEVAAFTNRPNHTPTKGSIKQLLLGMLPVKALVGIRVVVLTRLEQWIGPNVLMQRLKGQANRLFNCHCKGLAFNSAWNAMQMQFLAQLLSQLLRSLRQSDVAVD